MALRLLGTKLSKRTLPCNDLLKGLRPLHARPKTAVISSVEKGSFASSCPPRARRLPYHQASCTRPCSPSKALPGTSLIHGKRNFASGPCTTENVLKTNSLRKSSSASGSDKCPKFEAAERCKCECCSSMRAIERFFDRLGDFGILMSCIGSTVWLLHEIDQARLRRKLALDSDEY